MVQVEDVRPRRRQARDAPRGARFDQAHMRRANMSVILRHLRAHGGRSRAQLAAETGLSKATMSSLIADLAGRGLVAEGELYRGGTVGRPGLTVALDGRLVCGVGIEVNVDYLAMTVVDLGGAVVREHVAALDVAGLGVEPVLDAIARLVQDALTSLADRGLTVVAVAVAAPGVIDIESGLIRFAANIGWRDVPLRAELQARLGAPAPPIHLENDAKLGAVGEYAQLASDDVEDLLYLTGDVGVGAGVIAGGRLVRGWSGFAGEVGHLPLGPEGLPCNCGRTGCWETIVGLGALLRLAAPAGDAVQDPSRPLEDRLAILRSRADAGDERVVKALASIARDLSTGLSILVDVLNPRTVILGGYFAYFGDYLLAPVTASLDARRMDEGSRAEVTLSRLGLTAASRGGAHFAIDGVFENPSIVAARTGIAAESGR